MAQWKDDPAIKNFVEYLQIPSVQPDVNYGEFYFIFRTTFFILFCVFVIVIN